MVALVYKTFLKWNKEKKTCKKTTNQFKSKRKWPKSVINDILIKGEYDLQVLIQ